MENKPLSEEAATSNDQVQNTKSPPALPSVRPTEEFITDNAAAISELLKLRAAYSASARKIAIIPSTRDEYSHFQDELESIYNKLITVRDSLDVPLLSMPPNQAALDKIVARVTSKRKKAAAPTENNTLDNTSNVSKSLVKRETRKRATVDADGFRLPPKNQTAKPNALHTPTHINASSRPGPRDSIIDLAVLKNIPFNHDLRVIDDLKSDHLPVILTLYTGSALIKIPDQLSTNWENFKFLLNNKPLPILPSSSNDDLEIAIRRLGENISEALIEASKPKFKQSPLKLPSEIKAKILHRNRVRKFWQRTRDPAVKSEFRTLSREVTKDIRHFTVSRCESHIAALTP
ncbi:RNA-directed DNA polymerase from mobile element jockey [Trichonephila clavipes]|uniref:RNA-directed DNA polymerase from mobile element jockey n=1 Tax=Trichonephila clavipes TaxID=2585209 RepID=A0A8X6WEQ4_TRICX|nr:RNA-directed DNA polymerase from mobile element jockey [Trichonephila clavipes]